MNASPPSTEAAANRHRARHHGRDFGISDTDRSGGFQGAGDFGRAVAVDPLGGVVAAGTIANGSESEFGLIRAFF